MHWRCRTGLERVNLAPQSSVSSEVGGLNYVMRSYDEQSRRRVAFATCEKKWRSAGICFVWASFSCPFMSVGMGHVSYCPEMKIMKIRNVMRISGTTATTEKNLFCSLCQKLFCKKRSVKIIFLFFSLAHKTTVMETRHIFILEPQAATTGVGCTCIMNTWDIYSIS